MRRYVLLGFGLMALLARAPVASAQNQCVGLIGLDYTNPPLQFLSVGAVLNVQGTLGAGNVVGGDRVLFNKVQIQLDCVPSPTLTPQNCVDAGPAVSPGPGQCALASAGSTSGRQAARSRRVAAPPVRAC